MSEAGEPLRPRGQVSWRTRLVKALALTLGWAVVAGPVAYFGFMTDSRDTTIASHDARISPTRDGYATVDLGAHLPDLRYPTGQRLGVSIDLDNTNAESYQELIQRYAVIASHPEGEIRKVEQLVSDMAAANAVRGAALGVVGPALWLVVGRRRRREIWTSASWRTVTIAAAGLLVLGVAVGVGPWASPPRISSVDDSSWQPIAVLLPEATIPPKAKALEVQAGLTTAGSKRLIESAFDTYRKSVTFYDDLLEASQGLGDQLRQPEEGEQVAILVSDRHDNVGMDPVVRAIADEGSATVLFDVGDDTSTGEPWEAFSLDSLDTAFEDYEHKYAVLGNHDEGGFVSEYLSSLGFTVLDGEPDDDAGIRVLGVPDPRSSGLGSWRDATGISFEDQAGALADTACAADVAGERVSTLLVHDADLGRETLERGCVDLVIAGHLHVQAGPQSVTGDNGKTGATYTTGTTGGAAFAFALGSKLRRDAMVTLITYRDRVPVGLQPVTVDTTGTYRVSAYLPLPADDD